jgi:AhpD family alkylhydroperoxidase
MAMKRSSTFQKRVYTLSGFLEDARAAFRQMTALHRANAQKRISQAFAERIMLAVTQVNDCRYCRFGHARAALAAGVSTEELGDLLAGEFASLPPEEVVAVAFAQHYAEQRDRPDPAAWQRLVSVYGDEVANQIMAHIRMITMGNLLGNTFDAVLSRLRGRPPQGSHFYEEIAVLILAFMLAPVGLIAALLSFLRQRFLMATSQAG